MASLLLAAALASAEPARQHPPRRLVVDGVAARVEDYPFVAMLVQCSRGASCVAAGSFGVADVAGRCQCTTFCSGALVAPGAVLTAAHCLWNQQNRSAWRPGLHIGGDDASTTVFAVFGRETLAAARQSDFVAVREVVHGGYANVAQTKDNDIALAFLATCVRGRTTARVATSAVMGGGDACVQVTGLGWGRQDTFDPYWGGEAAAPLKATVGFFLHSSEVCANEYRRAVVDRVSVLPFYNYTAQQLANWDRTMDVTQEFSPDRHICYGASSQAGMCFGDSGGPVVARDEVGRWIVLGINGWTMNKCGIYADFGARVAFFAKWVQGELERRRSSALCGAQSSATFASWPVLPWNRSAADATTRCFEQGVRFACRNLTGAECIDWSKRCDGVPDCADGSDESVAAGCPAASAEVPEASLCQAVFAKLASAYQDAEAAWWPLKQAISLARPQANGVMLVEGHNQVGDACNAFLTQASEPFRLRSLNATDLALYGSCARDAGLRAAQMVYVNGSQESSLPEVQAIAAMCQEQVLYSSLFLRGRASLIDEFVQERQRCATPTALPGSGLPVGSASPSSTGSTPGWVAAALGPLLLLWRS